MSGAPGWADQAPPPARGGHNGQTTTAPNHSQPVTADDLRQWDETWGKAEVKDGASEGGYKEWPDGRYIGQIAAAAMERTRKDGTPMLVIRIVVLAGPSSGEYAHRRVISSSDQVRYVKQDLHNIGLDVEALSEVPEALPQWIGVCVEFALKSNVKNDKKFTNCYLNRWIDPDEVEAAKAEVGAVGTADNSDLPF